jgi:hypothetical protein
LNAVGLGRLQTVDKTPNGLLVGRGTLSLPVLGRLKSSLRFILKRADG